MINLHEGIKKSALRVYRSGAEAVYEFAAESPTAEAYGLPRDVNPNTLHIVFEAEKKTWPCRRMRLLDPLSCLLSETLLVGKTVAVKEVRRDAGAVFDVMEGRVHAVHGGEIVFGRDEGNRIRVTEVRSVSMISTSDLTASERARLKNVAAVTFEISPREILPANVRLSYMTRSIYWNDSYRVVMSDPDAAEFDCDLEHRVWLHNGSGSDVAYDRIAFMDSDKRIEIPVGGGGDRASARSEMLESAAPRRAMAMAAEASPEETEDVAFAETQQIYADDKKENIRDGTTASILVREMKGIKSRLVYSITLDGWGNSAANYELRLRDCGAYVSTRSEFLVYARNPKSGGDDEPVLVTTARAADYYYGSARKSITIASSLPIQHDACGELDEMIVELGRATQVRIVGSSVSRVKVPGEDYELETVRATIRNHRLSNVDFQLRTDLRTRDATSVKISVWDSKIGPESKIPLCEDKHATMLKHNVRAYNLILFADSVSEVEAVYTIPVKKQPF